MTSLVLMLVTVALTAGVILPLVRTVRGDGWGHRPPPPTRPEHEQVRAW